MQWNILTPRYNDMIEIRAVAWSGEHVAVVLYDSNVEASIIDLWIATQGG